MPQTWEGHLRLSQQVPSRDCVTSWGTAAALAMPRQDQLDTLPSTLGSHGCWVGGLPTGTGAAWPLPGASGAQAVLQGSNGLGEVQSIPSTGWPHSPGSSPGPQPQFPAAAPWDAPSAVAPMQRAQCQRPPHAAFYGPAAAAAQTWAAGTAELGAALGLTLTAPRAVPDGLPAWAAALEELELSGKVSRVGSTPLTWGVPKHPAALHPCPSAPHSPHPCLGRPRIPASCSTLCQSAGVHSVTSHLRIPPKPHGPCSPAAPPCPRPAQHGLHQAGAGTQSRFCSQHCREMSCQRAERRGAHRHHQPSESSSRLVPGQGSRGACGRASWAPC